MPNYLDSKKWRQKIWTGVAGWKDGIPWFFQKWNSGLVEEGNENVPRFITVRWNLDCKKKM